jgi:hypothetical protein
MPIQLKKPIVVRVTPASVSHAVNVEKTNKKGRPAEKPKNNIASTGGCRYILKASNQGSRLVLFL